MERRVEEDDATLGAIMSAVTKRVYNSHRISTCLPEYAFFRGGWRNAANWCLTDPHPG